jgi:hypothetical protein
LKNPSQKKRSGGVAQVVGPAFKSHYCKKKKKKEIEAPEQKDRKTHISGSPSVM